MTITLRGNGKVQGEVTVHSGSDRLARRSDEVYLCRCGQSAKRPFRDGTHKRVGFTPDA